MLRSFRVVNHRSFRDEQELNLTPAYDQERPVVPVAAVFGANASGKSNLVDAMLWLRDAVLGSFRQWEPESGIPRSPFRLDAEAAADTSSYVVDLVVDGVPYVYGVTLNDEVVTEEWLHSYPHSRERVIYERRHRSVTFGSTVARRRVWADLVGELPRDNFLFLSVAAQAGLNEVLPAYRWFRDGIHFGRHDAVRVQPRSLAARVEETLSRHPSFPDLVRSADLGISDVVVVETATAPSAETIVNLGYMQGLVRPSPASGLSKLVVFLHGSPGVPLGPSDQSAGTIAWTELLVVALSALDDGTVLVVDEVDASLHPRLTARLIELFRSESTNRRGAQLIFTTHDATLLGTSLGDELLKRDEVWFVEKKDGASRLYPLSDFHPRKGENRERRYLAGSYGAVPAVFEDSLVESVLAARTDGADGPA